MEEKITYLTLTQASRRAPGRPHSSTIWRWCRNGLRTQSGGRVYLKHIRAGRRVYTTEEWMTRFFHEITDADMEHFRATTPESLQITAHEPKVSSRRQKEIDDAMRRLEEEGI